MMSDVKFMKPICCSNKLAWLFKSVVCCYWFFAQCRVKSSPSCPLFTRGAREWNKASTVAFLLCMSWASLWASPTEFDKVNTKGRSKYLNFCKVVILAKESQDYWLIPKTRLIRCSLCFLLIVGLVTSDRGRKTELKRTNKLKPCTCIHNMLYICTIQ